ncbi:S8 family serine peptidase [Dyella sp.]|uniref:S8 family serine peptidase n=1 Tax=Dyella sp. TaxID=1869338 RepID=UPI002ED1D762
MRYCLTWLAASIAVLLTTNSMAANSASALQAKMDVTGVKSGGHYQRFIVSYRDSTAAPAASLQHGNALLGAKGANSAAIQLRAIRHLSPGDELVEASRSLSATEASQVMETLAADPEVKFVEPDLLLRAQAIPNDPLHGRYQWDYLPADGRAFVDLSTFEPLVNHGGANIQRAWDFSTGEGIVIASLDTGVTQHPDLALDLADAGYDFIIDPDVSGRPVAGRIAGAWDPGDWILAGQCSAPSFVPSSWHGTHVFGTAGGQRTDNGLGLAGAAYGAQVLPIRVLGHCGGFNSAIADAITWASGGEVNGVPANTHPAQVVNLSLGGIGRCSADSRMARAITGAIERGTVVVVAAGNDSADVSNYMPANCPGVIAVAATGISSRRAWFSNYGPGITLAAPGGGMYRDDAAAGVTVGTGFIWSAGNTGVTRPARATYTNMAGTSQAAPLVAGTVAMMQSHRIKLGRPLLSPATVAQILRESASAPAIAPSATRPIGAGILNAYEAVRLSGEAP